jgi:hypothetical protein
MPRCPILAKDVGLEGVVKVLRLEIKIEMEARLESEELR